MTLARWHLPAGDINMDAPADFIDSTVATHCPPPPREPDPLVLELCAGVEPPVWVDPMVAASLVVS